MYIGNRITKCIILYVFILIVQHNVQLSEWEQSKTIEAKIVYSNQGLKREK